MAGRRMKRIHPSVAAQYAANIRALRDWRKTAQADSTATSLLALERLDHWPLPDFTLPLHLLPRPFLVDLSQRAPALALADLLARRTLPVRTGCRWRTPKDSRPPRLRLPLGVLNLLLAQRLLTAQRRRGDHGPLGGAHGATGGSARLHQPLQPPPGDCGRCRYVLDVLHALAVVIGKANPQRAEVFDFLQSKVGMGAARKAPQLQRISTPDLS